MNGSNNLFLYVKERNDEFVKFKLKHSKNLN